MRIKRYPDKTLQSIFIFLHLNVKKNGSNTADLNSEKNIWIHIKNFQIFRLQELNRSDLLNSEMAEL